jgi:hypothetical protein
MDVRAYDVRARVLERPDAEFVRHRFSGFSQLGQKPEKRS